MRQPWGLAAIMGAADPHLAVPPGLPELPKWVLGDESCLGQRLPLGHAGHHSFSNLAGEYPPQGGQRLAVREGHEPVLQARELWPHATEQVHTGPSILSSPWGAHSGWAGPCLSWAGSRSHLCDCTTTFALAELLARSQCSTMTSQAASPAVWW